MGLSAMTSPNSALSLDRCLFSMTKMECAQRMSSTDTRRRALGLVPAERTRRSDRLRHAASAVGLRHWLRLQMKRTLSGSLGTI